MHVPVERDAFLIAIESPSLGLLSEITLIASCLLAITSGLIGLFRPGRWSKVLSVLGIVVSYQLLRPVIEFDPVGWLELTVLMIAVLLWDMPASLIDDLFERQPVLMLVGWIPYLVGIYVILRTLAVTGRCGEHSQDPIPRYEDG
jgi:hypothetical protein